MAEAPSIPTLPIRLVLADLAIIALVMTVGLVFHGVAVQIVPRHVVLTILPFAIGWMLAGPIAGAYRRAIRTSYGRTIVVIAIAWFGATLVGSGIRATPLFPGDAPVVFVLVTFGTGFVALGSWRLVVVRWNRMADLR